MKSITKLAATLTLAIIFTLNACEEKKKQDGADTKQPEAVAEVAEKTTAVPVETETVCGKGGGGVKLLECITDADGKLLYKFEYDNQNRIVKIDDKTITYADNLITAGTQKFVIKGNTVTVDKNTLTIDKDGYIISRKDSDRSGVHENEDGDLKEDVYFEEYSYSDGNLTHESDNNGNIDLGFLGSRRAFKYDNNKSPFSNSNTPKWLLQYLLGYYDEQVGYCYASKNNIIESYSSGGDYAMTDVYKYEYDKDGFPTKQTLEESETEPDPHGAIITRFIYRGGK